MNRRAVRFYDEHPAPATMLEEVLQGLAARPRRIAPKFFYDERGSRLFDAICELPEYYLARTEMAILESCRHEVAQLAGPDGTLIEFGSGALDKLPDIAAGYGRHLLLVTGARSFVESEAGARLFADLGIAPVRFLPLTAGWCCSP